MSFLHLVTPDDIKNEQSDLKTAAIETNASVVACTGLDQATRTGWDAFYKDVLAFCQEVPVWYFPTGTNEVVMSSNMLEHAQQLRANLLSHQQMLSKACKLSVPLFDPTKPPDTSLNTLTTAIRYGAIIAGFLGTAYIVGKAAEFIPKPKRA
jgi:hypothetical protein